MKTLQINSMGHTDTKYSEISLGDDSIFDNEMPDVLSYFNERIDSALEEKGGPAELSSNSLRTTIILATDDSLDLQDKDAEMILEAQAAGDKNGEMILEAQPAGDNFKSNFHDFCSKTY
jgi:hypothetical protein